MTRDDIIRMAREADLNCAVNFSYNSLFAQRLLEFAALVAAAEREACANLCLETEPFYGVMFAEAIRARGQA